MKITQPIKNIFAERTFLSNAIKSGKLSFHSQSIPRKSQIPKERVLNNSLYKILWIYSHNKFPIDMGSLKDDLSLPRRTLSERFSGRLQFTPRELELFAKAMNLGSAAHLAQVRDVLLADLSTHAEDMNVWRGFFTGNPNGLRQIESLSQEEKVLAFLQAGILQMKYWTQSAYYALPDRRGGDMKREGLRGKFCETLGHEHNSCRQRIRKIKGIKRCNTLSDDFSFAQSNTVMAWIINRKRYEKKHRAEDLTLAGFIAELLRGEYPAGLYCNEVRAAA